MSTKKGRYPYIFVDAADFRLDCGGDFLTVYTHGTHTAKHMFCSACGVHVFAFPRGSAEAGGISVNVHTVDRENVESLHVAYVPGDHLLQDFEPTVPSIPTSPDERRARVEQMSYDNDANQLNEVVEQQQLTSPNTIQHLSNPQASSRNSSPQQQQQQQKQQTFVNPYLTYTGVPGVTNILAPSLPYVPLYACNNTQSEATALPIAGQGLAGVNFFRKQSQRTPARGGRNTQPSIMQTLVHGGGAAAYAIGRAAGVLSPENKRIDCAMNQNNNSTSYDATNATITSTPFPTSASSSSSSRNKTRYFTQQITPIRAMIDHTDPLYNSRVRNTERKKLESMNSVVSIKHQLQRYLGQHKTPQRNNGRNRDESSYYD
jgi:hypothetical protein